MADRHWTTDWIEARHADVAVRRHDLEAGLEQRNTSADVVETVGLGPIKGRRSEVLVVDDIVGGRDLDQTAFDMVAQGFSVSKVSAEGEGVSGPIDEHHEKPSSQSWADFCRLRNVTTRFCVEIIGMLEAKLQQAESKHVVDPWELRKAERDVSLLKNENASLKAQLGITEPEPITFDVDRQSENVADAIGMRGYQVK